MNRVFCKVATLTKSIFLQQNHNVWKPQIKCLTNLPLQLILQWRFNWLNIVHTVQKFVTKLELNWILRSWNKLNWICTNEAEVNWIEFWRIVSAKIQMFYFENQSFSFGKVRLFETFHHCESMGIVTLDGSVWKLVRKVNMSMEVSYKFTLQIIILVFYINKWTRCIN